MAGFRQALGKAEPQQQHPLGLLDVFAGHHLTYSQQAGLGVWLRGGALAAGTRP